MNVVDKLVKEWAWRCDKGYPDINNPKDKQVLNNLLKEWKIEEKESFFKKIQEVDKEEVTVSDIINLLQTKKDGLSPEFIKSIYKQVETKGRKITSQIIDILKNKNLEFAKSQILTSAQLNNVEDDLLDYLTSSDQISPEEFVNKKTDNFSAYFSKKINFSEKFITSILDIKTGDERSKGVGAGEVALALFLKDGIKAGVGDVKSGNFNFEIKATQARLAGGRFGNFNQIYTELEEKIGTSPQRVKGGDESLPSYIANIYRSNPDKESTIYKILSKYFNEFLSNVDLSNVKEIETGLLDWYVTSFLTGSEGKDATHIVYINEKNFYVFNKEEFRNAIITKYINTTGFTRSTSAPQLLGISS